MKPKIFLSHSKKDKHIIERIANDLRSSGIDVWYDDWEIPVGESIRKKIFEEGIPNCDIFFVYLTDNSVKSYWVKTELDSAFFRESEERNSFLILFVDKEETRANLTFDLKSLNIPVLNNDNYYAPLCKLISKAWLAFSKKSLSVQAKQFDHDRLQIEKENLELEKRLFSLQKNGLIDLEKIKERLRSKRIVFKNEESETFLQAFHRLKFKLADGSITTHINHVLLSQLYPFAKEFEAFFLDDKESNLSEFNGELVIQGLVKVIPPAGEFHGYNILTDLGLQLARED